MIFNPLRNSHTARPPRSWAPGRADFVGRIPIQWGGTKETLQTGPGSACEPHHTHAQEMKKRAKRRGIGSPQVGVSQDLGRSEETDIHLWSHSLGISRAVPKECTRRMTCHSILWDGPKLKQNRPKPSAPLHTPFCLYPVLEEQTSEWMNEWPNEWVNERNKSFSIITNHTQISMGFEKMLQLHLSIYLKFHVNSLINTWTSPQRV